MAATHIPVLLDEALAALAVRGDGCYVDATYGRGGHSAALLDGLGADGRLLVIDRDPAAIRTARERHANDARVVIRHGEFQHVGDIVAEAGLAGRIDGALFDLGVSSPQLDDPARGFSFQADGPLDMRMNPEAGRSAADWLATVGERELADALFRYGEERRSRAIAKALVARRGERPFRTTKDLAGTIARIVGRTRSGVHPATRSFQAIRIAVNDELAQIERALAGIVPMLARGARLAVISFHSLEDRIVKRFIRRHSRVAEQWRGLPEIPAHAQPALVPVGRAIVAGEAEVAANPRARSARLRVAERSGSA
ncbi:MAG: 16S rRNA (cytosine(1402)-N(4))-methyltransferase RsmH [Pseudomonadota bacterium]